MTTADLDFIVVGCASWTPPFPTIPGFFVVMPIYMIAEKAADVIAGRP